MTPRHQIAFRVDSGIEIGSGHLVRCLTLAGELQNLNCEILFIMRATVGNLAIKAEEAGFKVRLVKTDKQTDIKSDLHTGPLPVQMQLDDARLTLDALQNCRPKLIIVDHYGLGKEWETELCRTGASICAIDDLANRQHNCHALLDTNYFEAPAFCRYDNLVPSNCLKMIGPSFALLHPQYTSMHASSPHPDGIVRRIFVFFGGTDSTNQSAKVLAALSAPNLAHLTVDIVLGINYQHREQITVLAASRGNVNIYQDLETLAGLIIKADLAIGAGGTNTWERMNCGIPSLIAAVAPNQETAINALMNDGYIACLASGRYASCEEWGDAISALIADCDKLVEMGEKSRNLVDGFGARYVAHLILAGSLNKIRLRSALLEDEDLLLKWANNSDVRKQSFTPSLITAQKHAEWFRKILVNPDCFLFIGESESGLPIGQVRFDIDNIRCEAYIDISIDGRLRGIGIGVKLLSCALAKFKAEAPGICVFAEVLEGNVPSQRLFARLGFLPTQPRRPGTSAWKLPDFY
jgi:UDP-2,4-diacetamido-2,4,6-trideoxy-beta-L-altropyranose hydrolase